MKINDNGIIRDMTLAEIKEMEQLYDEILPIMPSLEEIVAEQAHEIAKLKVAIHALLEKRIQ